MRTRQSQINKMQLGKIILDIREILKRVTTHKETRQRRIRI